MLLNYVPNFLGALLIQPNVSTLWNMKRELVEENILPIIDELHFTSIALSNKSKSQETFSYRRWCLEKLIEKEPGIENDQIVLSSLFRNEMRIVDLASQHAKHNYHAWNHRIWAVETLLKLSPKSFPSLFIEENTYSGKFILQHVSEHVAFNYHQYILKLVKKYSFDNFNKCFVEGIDNYLNPYTKELDELLGSSLYSSNLPDHMKSKYLDFFRILLVELVCTLKKFAFYQIHESVWYHRRYVVYSLIETYLEYHGLKNSKEDCTKRSEDTGEHYPKLFKADFTTFGNSKLHTILCEIENKALQVKCSENEASIVENLVKRHRDWLSSVARLNLNL